MNSSVSSHNEQDDNSHYESGKWQKLVRAFTKLNFVLWKSSAEKTLYELRIPLHNGVRQLRARVQLCEYTYTRIVCSRSYQTGSVRVKLTSIKVNSFLLLMYEIEIWNWCQFHNKRYLSTLWTTLIRRHIPRGVNDS